MTDEVVSNFAPSITVLASAIHAAKSNRDTATKEGRQGDVDRYDIEIESHEVAIEILNSMMDEE